MAFRDKTPQDYVAPEEPYLAVTPDDSRWFGLIWLAFGLFFTWAVLFSEGWSSARVWLVALWFGSPLCYLGAVQLFGRPKGFYFYQDRFEFYSGRRFKPRTFYREDVSAISKKTSSAFMQLGGVLAQGPTPQSNGVYISVELTDGREKKIRIDRYERATTQSVRKSCRAWFKMKPKPDSRAGRPELTQLS